MALEFKCKHCGQIIVVKHLNIGEEGKCIHCRNFNIVPVDSTVSEDDPDYIKYERHVIINKKPDGNKSRFSIRQIILTAVIVLLLTKVVQYFSSGNDLLFNGIFYFVVMFVLAYLSIKLSSVMGRNR